MSRTMLCSVRAVTCTGSPQGVGLLLLYMMHTDDCHSNQDNSYLVKFADDSAVLSLLKGTQNGHPAAQSGVCVGVYVCGCLREVGTKDIFSAVIFVLWVFFIQYVCLPLPI